RVASAIRSGLQTCQPDLTPWRVGISGYGRDLGPESLHEYTSSGFSNLNSNCVSELIWIWSGLVITAPPPPPAPAPMTAPFLPPRIPPIIPPTAAPMPTFRAAFLPSDEPVSVKVLLTTG